MPITGKTQLTKGQAPMSPLQGAFQGLASFISGTAAMKVSDQETKQKALMSLLPTLAARGMVSTEPTASPGTIPFGDMNIRIGPPTMTELQRSQYELNQYKTDIDAQKELAGYKGAIDAFKVVGMIQALKEANAKGAGGKSGGAGEGSGFEGIDLAGLIDAFGNRQKELRGGGAPAASGPPAYLKSPYPSEQGVMPGAAAFMGNTFGSKLGPGPEKKKTMIRGELNGQPVFSYDGGVTWFDENDQPVQ